MAFIRICPLLWISRQRLEEAQQHKRLLMALHSAHRPIKPISTRSCPCTAICLPEVHHNKRTFIQRYITTTTFIPINQGLRSGSLLMHISTTNLLGFIASTLAFPTNLETIESSPVLEKRWHYGFVAAYTTSDCSGDWNDTRPELRKGGGCTTWSPHGAYIGVNYGTGDFAFGMVETFSDAHCQIPSVATVPSHDPQNLAPFPSNEIQKSSFPDGFGCVALSAYANGVNSIYRSG